MCRYFASLYQCGHSRHEVAECAGPRRCLKPPHIPNRVQPYGCLQAYEIGRLFRSTRRLPYGRPDILRPYQMINELWGCDDVNQLTKKRKQDKLVEAKHKWMSRPVETYCMNPVPQEYRQSEDPANRPAYEVEAEEDQYEWSSGSTNGPHGADERHGRLERTQDLREVDDSATSMRKDSAVQEAETDTTAQPSAESRKRKRSLERYDPSKFARRSGGMTESNKPGEPTPDWFKDA